MDVMVRIRTWVGESRGRYALRMVEVDLVVVVVFVVAAASLVVDGMNERK